ncbi:MAG: DNA adenine methylase [Deltaproteobacteria bacterium]|jgi:DNA adenine methylase|nr:DNA adenine methylase [Deltaproteobacteria bacterium]
MLRPVSRVEVINDINREIVTLYRCLQWHLEEFLRYFKWVLVSRDEFDRLKRAVPDTLTDIQRAARFFYIQQTCFGGRIHNPSFGYSVRSRGHKLNLLRIEEELSAAHLRLSRVYIECLPYVEVISRYDRPETFFYLDPPYWGCEEYYGKNLFGKDDFTRLAEILAGIKGRFVMSINDRPEIRAIFTAFAVEAISTTYTCGQAKNVPARELLICNFEAPCYK